MDRLWAENDDSRVTGDPSLVVDVAGFEGPLDLLLHL
ncbi:segregation/condensation protein A, partial [Mesorhizobium sp. M7A.F.Ca.CA.002.04.1.1]